MNNTFDSKGGEQNIAQGKNAIGKQENNYFLQPLKPRTAITAAVLAAGLFGAGLAGWHWFAPTTQSSSTKGNQSPAIIAGRDAAVTYGISTDDAAKLAEKLLAPLQGQLQAKDEQIKALTEAITALSKTGAPAASINAALQELEQGNTAKAQAIFADVLKTKEAEGQQANKEAAAAARHLGALAYLNNPKEALLAYRKAVQLDPNNADGWNELGNLLHRTGELAQAEEAYRKVLALAEAHQDKEKQAWALGNLGEVYRIRGELDKAEEMYRKTLEISEPLGVKEVTANQYCNLGIVAYTRGELDKVEAMYRKTLEINEALGLKEATVRLYCNLGIMAYTLGELDKAEEMYKKTLEISEALGLKEATAGLYGNLGNVYKTRGDLDKAEEMYRKSLALAEALELKEATASLYGNLGNVCKQRGNLAQAEEYWRKSLRLFQEMGASQHPNAKKVQQALDELAQRKAGGRQ